jgi:hypothetical protein
MTKVGKRLSLFWHGAFDDSEFVVEVRDGTCFFTSLVEAEKYYASLSDWYFTHPAMPEKEFYRHSILRKTIYSLSKDAQGFKTYHKLIKRNWKDRE